MREPRPDETTRELMQTQLQLRDELFLRPESCRESSGFCIEHPSAGQFFQVGADEYALLSLLDGETTLGEAVSLTSRRLGPNALDEHQAVRLAEWLIESDLVEPVRGRLSSHRGFDSNQTAPGWQRWNPFWLRIPFGNPDRIVRSVLPVLGWIHSPAFLLVSIILWLVALGTLAGHWAAFVSSSRAVLAPGNWLSLGMAWVILKTLHEFSHGLACRRYGCEVKQTGLVLVLFAPLAFVDVTSSLRLRSKWQRIHIAAAGMIMELTVASIAVLVWSHMDEPVVRHLLHNVVLMASVSTLLFNINPLMRFDGYYILSDLLGIPNLYSRGSEFVMRLARRVFFGLPAHGVRERGGRAGCIRVYGLLAFAWRIVVCIGLAIAASALLDGLGILLAFAGLGLWIGRPAVHVLKELDAFRQSEPARLIRAGLSCSVVTGLAIVILVATPWPAGRTAPGFVELEEYSVVRAAAPGFVRRVCVASGQEVAEGAVLLELENPELQTELATLKIEVAQSEKRHEQHLKNGDTVAAQIETENRLALRKRLARKQEQVDSLQIRAPQKGRIVRRQLDWLVGTYAEEGQELLIVGDESRKEFRASLSQPDADSLHGHQQPLRVRLPGRAPIAATLQRIEPRATKRPLDESLTVRAGGRLPVHAVDTDEKDGPRFELVEPRFVAEFTLPESVARSLDTGARGEVTLVTQKYDSLGEGLYRVSADWIERRIAIAFEAPP